jgi:hypothetical protein
MKKPSLAGIQVEVHGWVMLAKVKAGKYRMVLTKGPGNMSIFWFFKPKGTKCIIGHYADDVSVWCKPADHPNLNKIVILPA